MLFLTLQFTIPFCFFVGLKCRGEHDRDALTLYPQPFFFCLFLFLFSSKYDIPCPRMHPDVNTAVLRTQFHA